MPEWYLAFCDGCHADDGMTDSYHWAYHRSFQDRRMAELKAAHHNRRKHDGEDVATIEAFESEAVGDLPRERPSKEELVA